jgi:2-oxoglutarate ferredoxin oxidoreductase subunit beta
MARAQHYGTELYTGVFYRNSDPVPTYESAVRARHGALRSDQPRARVLDGFIAGAKRTAPDASG